MESKIVLLTVCVLILVIYLLICKKKKKNIETFAWYDNISGPIVAIWKGMENPLIFARNYYYNTVPNYTWVTRYYEKKNDWIRANKGLPPLLPTSASNAKMNFNVNTENKNKEISIKPLGYFPGWATMMT